MIQSIIQMIQSMIQPMIQTIQLIIQGLGAVRFGLQRYSLARSWLKTMLFGSELARSRALWLRIVHAFWLGALPFGLELCCLVWSYRVQARRNFSTGYRAISYDII